MAGRDDGAAGQPLGEKPVERFGRLVERGGQAALARSRDQP
jgi:hypothetical protein